LSTIQPVPETSDAKPDLIYAHILDSPDQAQTKDGLYENFKSENDLQDSDHVTYSDVQTLGGSSDVPTVVAPSGDLYAQVQKR